MNCGNNPTRALRSASLILTQLADSPARYARQPRSTSTAMKAGEVARTVLMFE
jgi:hypothetical protein